jgi:VCBS repeat-containing protein
MKKSTILSLATAGAIVATSAFTFAAWDKMEDTATASLKVREPVTITAPAAPVTFTEDAKVGATDSNPTYTAAATFTLANVPESGYELDSSVKVEDKTDANNDLTEHFTVTSVVSGTEKIGKDDTSKTVTVTITPKDNTAANVAGKEVNVKITGEIVATTPAS